MTAMATIKNWTRSTIDPTILLKTRAHGLDVDWTTHGKRNGKYVYAIRTIVLEAGTARVAYQGTTVDELFVGAAVSGGWDVVLYGEVVDTQATKGAAQAAAEALVVA